MKQRTRPSSYASQCEPWLWTFIRIASLVGIFLSILLFSMLPGWPAYPVKAQPGYAQVLVLTADGPLTPVMAGYLNRGIRQAEDEGAALLVFQLNTPGGSIDLMNRMIQNIRASRVPVIVYIAPRGAMAGSAGTMITLAGHVAAMAPETAIGAASPVGGSGEDLGETMEAKEKNILKATIRTLAENRDPEAIALAEQMVETAQAVSANEALQVGLVDFVATDLGDLLRQLDGFEVELKGSPLTLSTRENYITEVEETFVERVLGMLTNPNIVLLLINIGVVSILIELSSPGGWVAGFIGVICLALSAYGLGILPVNWFGMVFLILAFVLFAMDISAPTHGALTVAGIGSLIVGALVLFNSPSVPSFQRVSVPLVIATSLVTGGFFFGVLLFALRSMHTPVLTGSERLVGRVGTARSELAPRGQVQLGGEQWTAELVQGEEPLPLGTQVQVVSVQGLTLIVRKARG